VHSNVASQRDGNAVGKEIEMDTGSESNRIRDGRSARDGRPNTNGHGAVESASERTPGSTDQPGTEVREDRIVVGIPTYNEEVAIGSVVTSARKYADEVIVVDDGSTDRTTEIANEVGATVIRHEENTGKGGAIRTLLSHVQAREMDALVLLDGDGQHVPADIPDVAAPVLEGECDMTIGSRYKEREATETPLHRRFGQRVLDYLTLGSSGENLTDSQSGFRAISPEAVSTLNIRTDGMGVESEMIGQAAEKNLEIREVPIDVRYDGIEGQTYSPVQHGLTVAAFLTQLIRDRHPLLFFGLPALFLLTLGGMVMVHSAWLYQTSGAFHHWRVLISGFVIILGTLSMFCGLVLSQVQNMIADLD
jgi:glycosyltransferase involved in cell wall biosynthesis